MCACEMSLSEEEDEDENTPSLLSDCCYSCCLCYERCCRQHEKERFSSIEHQVLSKSHIGKWPSQAEKSFTMPQGQSEINYALLQRWESQEILSRPLGKIDV